MTAWMLVEDEPDLYDMMLGMCEILGVEGVSFTNGEEAAAWIDAVNNGRYKGELPELALLDIRLPGSIDGTQVAAYLRMSPVLGNIGIVLMTAYKLSSKQETEAMARSGADKLIYKPIPEFHRLTQLLYEIIARR